MGKKAIISLAVIGGLGGLGYLYLKKRKIGLIKYKNCLLQLRKSKMPIKKSCKMCTNLRLKALWQPRLLQNSRTSWQSFNF